MTTRFWFPLNVEEMMHATRHLTAAQAGAFLRLICHQWTHGSVPMESAMQARISGVHPPCWPQMWQILVDLFQGCESGWVYEPLVREKAKAESITAKRSEARSKRGQRVLSDPPLSGYAENVVFSNKNNAAAPSFVDTSTSTSTIVSKRSSESLAKPEDKKIESIGSESERPRPNPNLVVFDSAAQRRLRPSGEKQEEFGLSNFDSSVVFTAKELGALSTKCHLVKAEGMVRELMDSDFVLRNKPAHRKKLVINLVQRAHDKRARDVANVVGNTDTPLIGPDEQRERQRRRDAASEFQRQQDEKIRQRRAAGQ